MTSLPLAHRQAETCSWWASPATQLSVHMSRLRLLFCSHAPGGDLQLVSMPGYGVDAFLSLQHLEGDWHEPLAERQSAPFAPEQRALSAYP